jgi:aryl sulfotransferase
MGTTAITWPQKQRELHNHHFDSTIWNDFAFRDDDIIIGTYGKSGTTAADRAQLLFNGAVSSRPGSSCACRRRT